MSQAPPPVSCRARRGALWVWAGAVLSLFVAGRARAQATDFVRCEGQRIRAIEITTLPPYNGALNRWWEAPIRWAAALHSTTRPEVVRGFLVLHEGDACTERRREESERALRIQPFIASAEVRARSDGAGGVVLVVVTRDELTPVARASTSPESPFLDQLQLGDGNVMGSGMYAAAEWRDGVVRDTYGVRVIDYQFLGRPLTMDVLGYRRDLGSSSWAVQLSRPFLTEFQRTGWRITAEDRNEVYTLYDNGEPVPLSTRRALVNVGGLVRFGHPGAQQILGLSLSREIDETGMPPAPPEGVEFTPLLQRFENRKNARLNVLLGLRNIRFRRMAGLEALTAVQDVPVGFQVSGLVGRSMELLGTSDDDILFASDLYAGIGGARRLTTARVRAEARRNFDDLTWDGILLSGSATHYIKGGGRNRFIMEGDWAAGWRERIPFQLTLGDRVGGVRGYHGSRETGARRAVVRLEDRWLAGTPWDQADLGLVAFVDAGRLWAGDIPLGVTTPVRVGAGVGIRVAIPPGSQRTWRLDIAYPFSRTPHTGWEIRLTAVNVHFRTTHEPNDVAWSRERSVPRSMFEWP
ncbi:MAG TPA: hypothetical protein VFK13_11255 [Gemmatimonadaceae bacterium]|nr:hypothetical protein [Gemmatimonadaceae bacterium]